MRKRFVAFRQWRNLNDSKLFFLTSKKVYNFYFFGLNVKESKDNFTNDRWR